jgi:hypothetical protein
MNIDFCGNPAHDLAGLVLVLAQHWDALAMWWRS